MQFAKEEIDNRFTYHAPDVERAQKHAKTRAYCHDLANFLNNEVPDGREKALMMTHLEEVMFWANAAIARQP